jgi:CHAT domain-containing protein
MNPLLRIETAGGSAWRLAVPCMLIATLFANAGAASPQMGDPLRAETAGKAQASKAANADFEIWDAKWRQIQSADDKVDWIDHFRVCAIKFRYRNYGELFRCLDLFEAKVARGDIKKIKHVSLEELRKSLRTVTPALTGWMRTSAYAELGEPELALHWAEKAWSALPEEYRQTKQSWMGGQVQDTFSGIAVTIGGSTMRDEEMTFWGRDNPAGLDVRGETIAMSLAAQRALLYARAGETDKARAALEDLHRWEALRLKDSVLMLIPTSAPYKSQAQLLAIGALFALGEYARVVKTYEDALAVAARKRHFHQFRTMLTYLWLPDLIIVPIDKLITRAFTSADARLFAVAVEDASNSLIYAESLAHLGRTAEASAMLDTMLAMPEIRAMGSLYWTALYQRGLLAQQAGQRDAAIQFLTQSVAAIESVRSTIAFEASKIGFAGDKQAVYAALVAALAEQGDWTQAFLIAERAKARSLVDLLAQRRDLGPPPVADDAVRRLFANVVAVDASVGLPESEAAVRGITLVADSRTALASSAPEAASLISVQSVSIADIATRMAPGESLIDYYSAGDTLYALVLNGTTVTGYKLSGEGLDADVRSFRVAIEGRKPAAAALGRRLYDRLIRPLASQLSGDRLTISPNGVLHYLPFDALMDGDTYLLDRFGLRLIPSAGALVYLKADRPTKAGTLLAFGNPDLGNPIYDLPRAQVEAVEVAALFPSSSALVRADASKTAIRELGSGFSILHFATHGKFNSDLPLESGLYLAKRDGDDGILTVADLYTLRFDADLVTLSACETALGKVANGDDVIGLTRGFLYAGARSIVASLWEVDDAATEQLMLSFYRQLHDHDKREALRLAQLETREKYPQPAFWAAFQVVGRAD